MARYSKKMYLGFENLTLCGDESNASTCSN